MNARDRRKIEMGHGSSDFSHAHAADSPEYVLILTELDAFLVRADVLSAQQREGFIDQHAATLRKRELESQIRSIHLPHLAAAGVQSARDDHELGTTFTNRPRVQTFAGFRSAVGTMVAAAEANREVMTKRGMSPTVLEDLKRAIQDFDTAVELGRAGRAAHVGASAELRLIGHEIVKRVRLLDAVNRLRFKDDPSLLAAWAAVSHVQANPKATAEPPAPGTEQPGTVPPAAPGDVRPAA